MGDNFVVAEIYTLTLTHEILNGNGKRIQIKPPKKYAITACNGDYKKVSSYQSHLLDELFFKFREALAKEQANE